MTTHYPAITVLALLMSTAIAVRGSIPFGARSAGVRAWATTGLGLDITAPGAC